ncbi:MAG: FkbM family methyltransferase [Candidatus Nitrosoglobus sp.]
MLVQTGMTGATMNLYVGLHEFEDMSFLLHMLREGDLFVDAGANVGTYTVLASKVRRAHSITIEPVPSTHEYLMDNINLNRIQDQVSAYNLGLAAKEGELRFSTELDSINHVLSKGEQGGVTVPVRTLDSVIGERMPVLVKIDVEGFEQEVIHGGLKALSRLGLQAMIIELNGLSVRYSLDDDATDAEIRRLGFKPARYLPFERRLEIVEQRNRSGNTPLCAPVRGFISAPKLKSFGRCKWHSYMKAGCGIVNPIAI